MLPPNILKRLTPEVRKSLGKAGLTETEAALKHEAKNERELQRLICNELNRRRSEGTVTEFFWQRSDKRTTGKLGQPDFIIALPNGRTIYWEIKFGNGQLSNEQDVIMSSLRDAGHTAHVYRSFETCVKALEFESGKI